MGRSWCEYCIQLCRRNIILKDDGASLYLIDWGYAGFYPRFFEVAMISCMFPYDAAYEQPLLQEIEVIGLTDEEETSEVSKKTAPRQTLVSKVGD